MRRMSAAPSGSDGVRSGTGTSTEPTLADEMSLHVLGIIRAYQMGAVVEARNLCPKRLPEAVPETAPRPAEGYIRNGIYHIADTASSRRN